MRSVVSNDTKVSLYNSDIYGISFRPGLKYLDCYHNYLTELYVPEGCEYVNCSRNSIEKLYILEGCETLDCSCNQLNTLVIFEDCCKDIQC